MPVDPETLCLTRLKDRSIVKRAGYANRIHAIHALAQRTIEDPECIYELLAAVEKLNNLWSNFVSEDDAVVNYLSDLDLLSEYSGGQNVELEALIVFCEATANRFRDYGRGRPSASVQGCLRASLSNFAVSDPQQEEQKANGSGEHRDTGFQQEIDQLNFENPRQPKDVLIVKPARLPEIPLPTFHGNIYEWTSFRDRFISMVDKQIHLSDSDKFYYLVGCCKDDALDAIKGIPVSGDNYELAWVTLKERFDKPRLVASSLVEKLLSAPKASTENLIELNKFLVMFDEGVSVLEALKIPNLGDFMIFSLASRYLPTLSIKLFEAQVASGFPTMRELLTFVKSRVAVLECIPRDTSSK